MKFPAFALLALSFFYLAACQNNPANPGSTNPSTDVPVADYGPPPSSDPAVLTQQMLSDFLAARQLSHQYDSSYQKAMNIVMDMKHNWRNLDEGNRAKVGPINESITKFTTAYFDHRAITDQMDSLTTKFMAKSVSVEDAQKQWISLRGKMHASGERLSSAQVNLDAWKKEYESIYSEANKNAAGKQ